jgi:hypothetical protein
MIADAEEGREMGRVERRRTTTTTRKRITSNC